MGLRTWLYNNTGIKLKKFKDQKIQNEQESFDDVVNSALLHEKLSEYEKYAPKYDDSYIVRDEFIHFKGGNAAMQKLLDDPFDGNIARINW